MHARHLENENMRTRTLKIKTCAQRAKNKEQRTQIQYTSVSDVSLLFGLQVFTTVCSSSDLVGSVSSLCVWRCGLLLM
jgi:translation initiation factor RLI1